MLYVLYAVVVKLGVMVQDFGTTAMFFCTVFSHREQLNQDAGVVKERHAVPSR